MRVLYILNSVSGGASVGIYEMLRGQPPLTAYAIVPSGNLNSMSNIFTDIDVVPVAWWNIPSEFGIFRRTAQKFGHLRRGTTHRASTSTIKSLINKWEIDLVHTGTSLTLDGALAAYELNIPHIWHIKEAIGSQNRVQFPLKDHELVNYISNMSSRVVVMSEYIGSIFEDYDCPNLELLPDGVDTESFQNSESQNLRIQLDLQPDEFLVGMVAGLQSTWKRHELFIEMASLIIQDNKKVRFVIIGGLPNMKARFPYDTSRRYAERILNLAKKLIPENRLTIIEHINDVPDVMRSLDVLVHPCEIEPFGRVAIEAMAAGTPVVGPYVGGISETVINNQTGLLVSPNDTKAFAYAIEVLLNNRKLRKEMGIAGQKHVEINFSIKNHIEALMRIYDFALSDNSNTSHE